MRLVTPLRPGRVAFSATTAILAVALGAGPAAAATWTVAPGGPFTGHAGTTKLEDTTDGNSLPFGPSRVHTQLACGPPAFQHLDCGGARCPGYSSVPFLCT
jgi:hypothetical protein